MSTSALGPCLGATITTSDVDACVSAWCDFLHHTVAWEDVISSMQAEQWNRPALAGSRTVWLKNASGEPWLRFIEDSTAAPVDAFHRTGWLSLEINVQDVEALHRELLDSPFTIIGPPATLDVSSDISAMQVVGPAGEVLYLTEIKKAVPGFDLPLARSTVDKLFIPVLLASDRDQALTSYQQFPNTTGNCFDTKITVLNRAHGLVVDTRHPVATVQLSGKNLIEIDEFPSLLPPPDTNSGLPAGISMISFAVDSGSFAGDLASSYVLESAPLKGKKARLLAGSAGELIEIIES
ncbi:MAG: hypothetical protein ABJK20_02175 [Halieaceae bacterium]